LVDTNIPLSKAKSNGGLVIAFKDFDDLILWIENADQLSNIGIGDKTETLKTGSWRKVDNSLIQQSAIDFVGTQLDEQIIGIGFATVVDANTDIYRLTIAGP